MLDIEFGFKKFEEITKQYLSGFSYGFSQVSYCIFFVQGLFKDEVKIVNQDLLIIGSDADCDLTVFDSGVAPQHFSIQADATVFGPRLVLKAMVDGVRIDDHPLLKENETANLYWGSTVYFGDTAIQINRRVAKGVNHNVNPKLSSPLSASLEGPVLDLARDSFDNVVKKMVTNKGHGRGGLIRDGVNEVLRVARILIAAILIGGTLGFLIPKHWYSELTRLSNQLTGEEQVAASLSGVLVNELRERVKKADLHTQVSVEKGPGKSVIVEGHLPIVKANEWNAIRMWFDQSSGSAILINKLNTVAESSFQLGVKGIWGGNPSFVIASDGRRVSIGDKLGQGWTLLGVSDDGLVVERTGKSITVPYSQIR